MADIKIVVDTGADMPKEIREKYDIGQINFLTIFGETSYVAAEEISNDEFYKKLSEENILPTTAQTPYGDMYDYFLEESKKHDTVIYFALSSKGSGQYNTARIVAEEIKETNPDADIRIVDTMNYSIYIGVTVLHAVELIREGKSADEIIEDCKEYMDKWGVYLLVGNLKYLEKGGRINKASAIVGSLLDIKPVLAVKDGLIEAVDKLRGSKKLTKKLIGLVNDNPDFDNEKKEFLVIHSDKEKGEELVNALKEEFDDIKLVMFTEFGPIIGTHAGPGCYAVMFRLKDNK